MPVFGILIAVLLIVFIVYLINTQISFKDAATKNLVNIIIVILLIVLLVWILARIGAIPDTKILILL